MTTVKHQFSKKDFYKPSWKIWHLFLGTFNPMGGQPVNYFYGRKRNKTWNLLSTIFNEEFDASNKKVFLERIKLRGIACMDIIDFIETHKDLSKILGKGYSDNAIINGAVKRQYNTNIILEVIEKNPNLKIYSTWGKGSTNSKWLAEIARIENIIPLVSPSMAARVPKGEKKFDYMLADWANKIICNS